MVELRCPCCQSTAVTLLANGMYKCQSCQNDFFYNIGDNQREKLNGIIDLRQRFEFEDALDLLDTFISENNSVADGYFQKLLCSYGVTYVKDYDGVTFKPTISRASPKPITSLSEYNLLLQNSPNNIIKEDYINKINEIEKIRIEIIEKANKEEPYDIFICYKRTANDNQSYTIDSKVGRDIYDDLVSKGYKVFFAEETLTSGEEYEPVIYNALMSSTVMLVIAASKKDYLMSPWVKNEWQRFFKLVQDDESKKKTLIPVTAKGFAPEDLPIRLSKLQVLEYDGQFVNKLNAILSKKISTNLKSRLEKTIVNTEKVKPIQVNEVVINKRTFSKVQSEVILKPSDKTNLEDAKNFLKKGIFEEAEYYAKRVLASNPNNADASWICFLADYKVADENNITSTLPKVHKTVQEMNALFDNDISLIVNAIENDPATSVHKLNVIKNIILESAKLGNISTVLFNLYLEYIPSEEELDFISILNNNYLNSYIRFATVSIDSDLEFYENMIYNSLTKLGAEGLIQNYNNLGRLLSETGRYKLAIKYYDKSLELFASSPDALYGRFICSLDNKSKVINLDKLLDTEPEIDQYIDVITRILKGGYKVRQNEQNYVYRALRIASEIIKNGKVKLGVKLFNEIFKLIPDDFNLIDDILTFGEELLLVKKFEEASFYFQEVISKEPYNIDAHLGLFKVKLGVSSNYELLLLEEGFYKHRDNFSTLREAEANAGNTLFTKFSELHDSINKLDAAKKTLVVKQIKYLISKEISDNKLTRVANISSVTINAVTKTMISNETKKSQFIFSGGIKGAIFRVLVVIALYLSYTRYYSNNSAENFGAMLLGPAIVLLFADKAILSIIKDNKANKEKKEDKNGLLFGVIVGLFWVSGIIGTIFAFVLGEPIANLSNLIFTTFDYATINLISLLFIFVPLIIKFLLMTIRNLKNKKKISAIFIFNLLLSIGICAGGYAGSTGIINTIDIETRLDMSYSLYEKLVDKTDFDFMKENNYKFDKYKHDMPTNTGYLYYKLFYEKSHYDIDPIYSIINQDNEEVALMYNIKISVLREGTSSQIHEVDLFIAFDINSEKILDIVTNRVYGVEPTKVVNSLKDTLSNINFSEVDFLRLEDVSSFGSYSSAVQIACRYAYEMYSEVFNKGE